MPRRQLSRVADATDPTRVAVPNGRRFGLQKGINNADIALDQTEVVMNRCLLVFDFNANLIPHRPGEFTQKMAYADIRLILAAHGFKNIQGTTYLSNTDISEAHCTLALQELSTRLHWFSTCATRIWIYRIASISDGQFIADHARQEQEVLNLRIARIRKKLAGSGLSQNEIEEILSA